MARKLFALLAGAILLPCGGAILPGTAALARQSLDTLCVLPGQKVKRYYEGCEKDGGQRAKFEDTMPDQVAAPTPTAKPKRQEPPTTVAAAPVSIANPLDSKACHDG